MFSNEKSAEITYTLRNPLTFADSLYVLRNPLAVAASRNCMISLFSILRNCTIRIFSRNENSKKICFKISCFNQNTNQEIFGHEKTLSVTGSYHADKRHLVDLAIKLILTFLHGNLYKKVTF